MDRMKIGRFIAERRRLCGMTQAQLAELLHVTDRAVSKWENGRSTPDSSIMLELCAALEISVNDLLYGEVVTVNEYNEKTEKALLEMVKQKELSDRRLLTAEIFIGALSCAVLIILVFVASLLSMEEWKKVLLIAGGVVAVLIGLAYALRIEQTAGYYECAKCGHRYVPTYRSVFFAAHINRTRRMRCPECGQKSWQKKVITKE